MAPGYALVVEGRAPVSLPGALPREREEEAVSLVGRPLNAVWAMGVVIQAILRRRCWRSRGSRLAAGSSLLPPASAALPRLRVLPRVVVIRFRKSKKTPRATEDSNL